MCRGRNSEPKSRRLWALHRLSLGAHHRVRRRSASEGEQHPLKLWFRALRGQDGGGARGAQCSEHSQLHPAIGLHEPLILPREGGSLILRGLVTVKAELQSCGLGEFSFIIGPDD